MNRLLKILGLKLVPIEPTPAMLRAAQKPISEYREQGQWMTNRSKHRLRWLVMLDAAPSLWAIILRKPKAVPWKKPGMPGVSFFNDRPPKSED